MTQDEKELLLKDLCGRLSYGVKVHHSLYQNPLKVLSINPNDDTLGIGYKGYPIEVNWEDCKPYLFPMESMTEEQKKELQSLMIRDSYGILYHTIDSFDYLYKNHIDIRGLIEKGLAIDATGLNYEIL